MPYAHDIIAQMLAQGPQADPVGDVVPFPMDPAYQREILRRQLQSGKQQYETTLPQGNVVVPLTTLESLFRGR